MSEEKLLSMKINSLILCAELLEKIRGEFCLAPKISCFSILMKFRVSSVRMSREREGSAIQFAKYRTHPDSIAINGSLIK